MDKVTKPSPGVGMPKPRLLIPVFTHFSVRYILRTGMLTALTEFTQPIVALSWQDPALENEFSQAGAEILHVPNFTFSPQFKETRELVNFWHKQVRQTNTTEIDIRREASLLGLRERVNYEVQILKDRIKTALPARIPHLLQQEESLFWSETNYQEFDAILDQSKPDAVFSITPFVNKEEPLLRCAQKRGVLRITSILSFDNVTSRTRLPVSFEHYLVWNRYNHAELLRAYPDITPEQITISGPPQFDFYYDPANVMPEEKWRSRLGLPSARPVILFGGGTYKIVPNEPLFLKQLDDAISNGEVPAHPIILFRRHPGDIASRWQEVLSGVKNTFTDQSWQANESRGQINITHADIEQLCSTLAHCAVQINSSSTLTVDGAVFDRPQIGPAYDPGSSRKYDRVLKELYIREHYIPITNSGGLDLVYSRPDFIRAVNDGFEKPAERTEGRKKIVEEICTYNDGQSTLRVVKKLRQLLGG